MSDPSYKGASCFYECWQYHDQHKIAVSTLKLMCRSGVQRGSPAFDEKIEQAFQGCVLKIGGREASVDLKVNTMQLFARMQISEL